ncbi:MAG: hypothetical protein K0Q67_207 [Cellvibrio sp.]|jgi:hypothetical protein|nr:hypothetical protein [Cellvibrio sp.]
MRQDGIFANVRQARNSAPHRFARQMLKPRQEWYLCAFISPAARGRPMLRKAGLVSGQLRKLALRLSINHHFFLGYLYQ